MDTSTQRTSLQLAQAQDWQECCSGVPPYLELIRPGRQCQHVPLAISEVEAGSSPGNVVAQRVICTACLTSSTMPGDISGDQQAIIAPSWASKHAAMSQQRQDTLDRCGLSASDEPTLMPQVCWLHACRQQHTVPAFRSSLLRDHARGLQARGSRCQTRLYCVVLSSKNTPKNRSQDRLSHGAVLNPKP